MENYQYVLPKVGVATNGMQLKLSQQKLLQQFLFLNHRQNYQKNHIQKDSYTDRSQNNHHRAFLINQMSDSNPFRSQNEDKNLHLSRAQSLSKINKNLHQQLIKATLSHELANQIAIKQQLKKYKRQEQIERQKQIVRYNKLLEEKQLTKQKGFREDFRQQANHISKMKELKNQQQKYSQYLQKSQIDKQYPNSQDAISKIMQGIEQPLNTKRSTQFQLTRNSQSSIQNYNNPQVKIIPIKSHHKPSFEQKSQLKIKMKETLLEQMRQNSERKIQQKLQRSMTKYVDDKYKVMDNPIINPVDLKIAKDNPYLIKQLLAKKMAMQRTNTSSVMTMGSSNEKQINSKLTNDSLSNRSSFLSRRGSNSLPRLVY